MAIDDTVDNLLRWTTFIDGQLAQCIAARYGHRWTRFPIYCGGQCRLTVSPVYYHNDNCCQVCISIVVDNIYIPFPVYRGRQWSSIHVPRPLSKQHTVAESIVQGALLDFWQYILSFVPPLRFFLLCPSALCPFLLLFVRWPFLCTCPSCLLSLSVVFSLFIPVSFRPHFVLILSLIHI